MSMFTKIKCFLFRKKSAQIAPSDSVKNKEILQMSSLSAAALPEQPSEVIPQLVKHEHCVTYLKDKLECQDVRELVCGLYGIDVYSVVPSRSILDQEDPKQVVVKVFRFGALWKHEVEGKIRNAKYQNEFNCYQNGLNHAHIVEFLSSFEFLWNTQKKEYFVEKSILLNDPSSQLLMSGIVLEQLECTLLNYVQQKNMTCLNDMLTKAVFYQIGGALVYLHGVHFMVHKDLKWNNIGVSGTDSQGVPHLKLIDFGNALVLKKEQFQAAEIHSSCFDLSLTKCEIKRFLAGQNDFILMEQNAFLQESFNFTRMLVHRGEYDSNGKFIDMTLRFNVGQNFESDIASQFEELGISDPKLKKLLIRMATTKFDFEKISITSAMNYFIRK